MNLLVTGGAGFIGSNFVLMALARGYKVVNLDALTYAGNLNNLKEISPEAPYKFVHGSITDRHCVERVVESGFEGEIFYACINFAAESHVDRSIHTASLFAETNVLGTVTLLEESRRAGIPCFIQISTDEVYGSLHDASSKFTLHSPIEPSSPYSASKAAADHLALSFYRTHGYDVRVTRCTNNYGRFQYPEKLIPTIITNALSGKRIPVYGDGLNVRDWIYVEDHCEGIFDVLEKGKAGRTYLFGGSNEVTNLDLVKEILTILADLNGVNAEKYLSLIEFVQDRPGHDKRYAIDWSNSEKELGWKPQTSFKKGLRKTVEWYLANKEWWLPLVKHSSTEEAV